MTEKEFVDNIINFTKFNECIYMQAFYKNYRPYICAVKYINNGNIRIKSFDITVNDRIYSLLDYIDLLKQIYSDLQKSDIYNNVLYDLLVYNNSNDRLFYRRKVC